EHRRGHGPVRPREHQAAHRLGRRVEDPAHVSERGARAVAQLELDLVGVAVHAGEGEEGIGGPHVAGDGEHGEAHVLLAVHHRLQVPLGAGLRVEQRQQADEDEREHRAGDGQLDDGEAAHVRRVAAHGHVLALWVQTVRVSVPRAAPPPSSTLMGWVPVSQGVPTPTTVPVHMPPAPCTNQTVAVVADVGPKVRWRPVHGPDTFTLTTALGASVNPPLLARLMAAGVMVSVPSWHTATVAAGVVADATGDGGDTTPPAVWPATRKVYVVDGESPDAVYVVAVAGWVSVRRWAVREPSVEYCTVHVATAGVTAADGVHARFTVAGSVAVATRATGAGGAAPVGVVVVVVA